MILTFNSNDEIPTFLFDFVGDFFLPFSMEVSPPYKVSYLLFMVAEPVSLYVVVRGSSI